ncbi:MAG: PLP-dependent aspartate aminotransferase family protein [Dysgonamonadaceae bacterium]|jgi:cystathionine gamma-lyase|nr:PLP-dependent aspartate aminotransferase family protein [Dysgonamonadaceae bacterium]
MSKERKLENYGFATKSIHAGESPNYSQGAAGDVVAPIHLTTTYAWHNPEQKVSDFDYVRSGNPTRKAYEEKLAAIENVRYGLAFASGLAAETTIFQTLLRPGDHVIGFDDLYGGTRRLLDDVFNYLSVSYIDLTDLELFRRSIRPETKMLWIESPTNPLIKICDIRALAEIAHSKGIIVVVDNTFMSPYFQQPAALGADIILHSTTKYIGGHSDVLGGAIMTSDDALYEKLKAAQNNCGAVLPPFDCYLNMRGIKTLAVRMEQHQKNALRIAEFLENHPKVKRVLYPGLPSHPQHELTKKQASGYGGMVSFELKGELSDAVKFMDKLSLFVTAESLGGVESLIELPVKMTHVHVAKEVCDAIGISDTLIRMSVGIENVEDLLADLEQAL